MKRMQAIEQKFPDPGEFQKYAEANALFLASRITDGDAFLGTRIGDLAMRLDRIEEKQLTRTQVTGIVIATLVAAIGVTAALFAILKAAGLLH